MDEILCRLIRRAGPPSHEIFQSLLEKGADPNLKNPDGSTALMAAVSAGETDVIYELLKAGADPEEKNANGETAAEIAKKTWKKGDNRDKILQLWREYDDEKGIHEK
jgi:hypothetical protein